MIQSIRKIGNSRGIILPKSFLKSLGDQSEVDIEQTPDGIIIKPLHPRHNWENLFDEANKQDKEAENDPFNELQNEFDKEEWTW